MLKNSLLESIGSQRIDRMVQFRVKVGSDLLLAIREAVEKEGIKTGVLVSGMGALNKAVFRNLKVFPEKFPISREDRIYMDIITPMELVSLGGWIASGADGRTEIHAHFSASTVAGDTVRTFGGHLTEGTIAGVKAVVAIAVLEDGRAVAEYDEGTKSTDIRF